jgi:predicted transcriptional regulator
MKRKKIITLNDVVEENLKDPEFAKHYRREQIINSIAKMIHDIRKSTGMTQSQLAKKVQTTQPVIARLESGRDSRIPSLDLLMRIADAAGAKLDRRLQA